ncbi:MAG: conjugal transfer protein TraF [Deltaproteobacteria bacterium]|nr:conjugal transfer protein TraF [Deltaproteobacteria bacterium]
MKKYFWLVLINTVVFSASHAWAMEFQPLGFEASSIGGAGVAASKGSYAPYYNPALLAERRYGAEFSLSGGFGIREIDVVDHLDRLASIDVDETIGMFESGVSDPLNPPSLSTIQDILDDLETIQTELQALAKRNGIQLMPNAAFGAQIKNVGVGVYGVSEGSAYAVIDPERLDIILPVEMAGTTYYVEYDVSGTTIIPDVGLDEYEARSFEYAINNGLTYLQLTGLAYAEIPIAYGHRFKTGFGSLDVGASFKVMPGYTYEQRIDIDTESDELSDSLDNNKHEDTAFGFDAGLLFKPDAVSGLALGIVGKNLNTPAFETASGGELEVDPQVRAGMAYDLLGDKVTLALDLDVTENETFIPNYNSRFIGGGFNLHPFSWLSLRGGLMQNMSESDEGIIYTGGFSIGSKWIQLDLTGQMSQKKGEYDGDEIPRYARVQLAFVSRWF